MSGKFFTLTCAGAALMAACMGASATAADVLWNVGTADYNVAANWTPAMVPNFANDDRAVIGNGGMAFLNAVASANPAAVVMGLNAGQTGTLEIRSGGSLTVENFATVTGNGSVTAGAGGTGTLRVLAGGTLFAFGPLVSGNNAANTIVMGGPAAGTATVTVATATFGGTTQVHRNTTFSTTSAGPGNITFNGTSVYTPVIDNPTQAGVAVLDAQLGDVVLGGTLRPQFTFNPAAGTSWNLLHGNTVTGAFAAVQATGLGPGLRLVPSTIGTAGDQNLRITVDQVLTLNVDRNTRVISLANPAAGSLSFDGYAIQSASGQLNRNAWNSLDDQNALGGDWLESTGSNANKLSELKPTSAGTMTGGTSINLGQVYAPLSSPPPFGTPNTDDITFTYAKTDGTVVTGDVSYTGINGINNLVLQIAPNGEARMKNTSSYNIAIDGYSITSASGSLFPSQWTSFDDQNIGDWLESSGSNGNKLAELKPTSSTMMIGGSSTASLGRPWISSGTRDLVFQFVQAGQSTPTTGVVVYESFGNADFDGDGDVDGRDFLTWQRGNGLTGAQATLANGNGNGDNVINGLDLAVWKESFGNVRPSSVATVGAVPEPAACLLAGVACTMGVALRRRENVTC